MTFDCPCGNTITVDEDLPITLQHLYGALLCVHQCDYPWRAASLPSVMIDEAEDKGEIK